VKRPYFFEIFAVANLIVVALFAHDSLRIVGSPLQHFFTFAIAIGTQAICGIAVRSLIALMRRDRTYFAAIRTREWLLDTLRLVAAGAVVIVVYGWIKLVVPVYHPRLFDAELWELDRILFFGIAPTTFFLDVFGAPSFLRAIDWSYANVFFVSAFVAFAWALSHPERRMRIAFANGNSILWISGAWLYLASPSLGPAFRFPEVWFAHAQTLQITQTLQAVLMRNYQNVLRAWNGTPVTEPVQIMFGIGAFPSLHVAFQMYAFLWMRRVWRAGQVLFGIFAFAIFLGSMITGWHYLVDSLFGAGMAYVIYRLCFPKDHGDHHAAADDPRRSAGGADRAGRAGADRAAAE
jgi:PAP2 superfamily